eukprot:12745770-Alexandrium_andersonii.AAC.1
MSASLVGSEMCIRDSTLLSPLRPALPCASLVACLRPGRFRPRARGPVSYTHLTLPTICSV